MKEYTLPHFGKLAIQNLETDYDITIEFKGTEIQIDLNFENESIDTSTMDKVKNLIENIEKFDEANKTYMLNDYNDEDRDTVKFYLENHLKELGIDNLSMLINFEDTTTEPQKQLFAKLKLVRIGVYPDSTDHFAT